jgi:hypothetical protein
MIKMHRKEYELWSKRGSYLCYTKNINMIQGLFIYIFVSRTGILWTLMQSKPAQHSTRTGCSEPLSESKEDKRPFLGDLLQSIIGVIEVNDGWG